MHTDDDASENRLMSNDCCICCICVGPLQYFSDRFLWLQAESETAFSDVNGKNIALLRLPSDRQVTSLLVMDNSHKSGTRTQLLT